MENIDCIDVTRSFIEYLHSSRELYDIDDVVHKDIKLDPTIINVIHKRNIQHNIKVYSDIRIILDTYIKTEDFKKFGVIVAGGSLCRYFVNQHYINDLDIFIIGSHNVHARVIGLIETICSRHYNLTIYLSNNCITLANENIVIQIILKYYDKIIDVLNDFDLGSSMIAYNGKNIFVNEEGRFTLETGYNIFNAQKIRYSYKTRIMKYNSLGFGLLHTNIKPGGRFNLDCINVASDYDGYGNFRNISEIMIKNVYNLIKNNNRYCIIVDIDDLKNDKIEYMIDRCVYNYFNDTLIHNMKYLNKIFNAGEILQIIQNWDIDRQIINNLLKEKINTLTMGKFVTFTIADGSVNRMSASDNIDLAEFCGPDYIDYSDIKIAIK